MQTIAQQQCFGPTAYPGCGLTIPGSCYGPTAYLTCPPAGGAAQAQTIPTLPVTKCVVSFPSCGAAQAQTIPTIPCLPPTIGCGAGDGAKAQTLITQYPCGGVYTQTCGTMATICPDNSGASAQTIPTLPVTKCVVSFPSCGAAQAQTVVGPTAWLTCPPILTQHPCGGVLTETCSDKSGASAQTIPTLPVTKCVVSFPSCGAAQAQTVVGPTAWLTCPPILTQHPCGGVLTETCPDNSGASAQTIPTLPVTKCVVSFPSCGAAQAQTIPSIPCLPPTIGCGADGGAKAQTLITQYPCGGVYTQTCGTMATICPDNSGASAQTIPTLPVTKCVVSFPSCGAAQAQTVVGPTAWLTCPPLKTVHPCGGVQTEVCSDNSGASAQTIPTLPVTKCVVSFPSCGAAQAQTVVGPTAYETCPPVLTVYPCGGVHTETCGGSTVATTCTQTDGGANAQTIPTLPVTKCVVSFPSCGAAEAQTVVGPTAYETCPPVMTVHPCGGVHTETCGGSTVATVCTQVSCDPVLTVHPCGGVHTETCGGSTVATTCTQTDGGASAQAIPTFPVTQCVVSFPSCGAAQAQTLSTAIDQCGVLPVTIPCNDNSGANPSTIVGPTAYLGCYPPVLTVAPCGGVQTETCGGAQAQTVVNTAFPLC